MITVSPALILAEWSRKKGLALDPEVMPVTNPNEQWPSFVNRTPDEPQQIITFYHTSGITQGKIHKLKETVTKYGVQVRVRSLEQELCFEKIAEIVNELDKLNNYRISVKGKSFLIQAVTQSGDINDIGWDDQQRENFTANFLATITFAP